MKKEIKKKHNILFFLLMIIILFCIFYVIFSYVKSFFKNHINTYQVENGSLKKEERFKGFVYRSETVINAPKSSYCSFIYKNNQRVSKDSIVMIFTDKNYNNANMSSDYNVNDVYNKMIGYENRLDDNNFYNTYSFHNNVDNFISDMKNNIATYIDSAAYKDKDAIKIYAKHSGILTYCVDGYEGLAKEDFDASMLLYKDYTDSIYKEYYDKEDSIGKIVYDPFYNIVFDTDSEMIKSYVGKKVKIELLDKKDDVEGALDVYTSKDGKTHYILTLDKYLEEYINYRIVDFSIVYMESFGMKIPNACVFSRNCFAVEKEYVENNELDNNYYIYKLDDKNNKKQCKVDVSFVDDKYYYILYDENNNILNINDRITYHDKVYNISIVKAFDGVFCINKGYKMFKIINVLDKNTEYSIIDRSGRTALKEYDILLLNVDF